MDGGPRGLAFCGLGLSLGLGLDHVVLEHIHAGTCVMRIWHRIRLVPDSSPD